MPRSALERVFEALEASGARYLVAGGVAVVLHGHPRFTADLDLALALDRENLSRALRALASRAGRPRDLEDIQELQAIARDSGTRERE